VEPPVPPSGAHPHSVASPAHARASAAGTVTPSPRAGRTVYQDQPGARCDINIGSVGINEGRYEPGVRRRAAGGTGESGR
jgi:hypothetical protein